MEVKSWGGVNATGADIALLARLLRAEAEWTQGMLLVGNVGINRVRAIVPILKIFVPLDK